MNLYILAFTLKGRDLNMLQVEGTEGSSHLRVRSNLLIKQVSVEEVGVSQVGNNNQWSRSFASRRYGWSDLLRFVGPVRRSVGAPRQLAHFPASSLSSSASRRGAALQWPAPALTADLCAVCCVGTEQMMIYCTAVLRDQPSRQL